MDSTNAASPAVLVVGAGPVGLVAAIELARRGVAVRLIDALESPTSEARAVVVHARSLEMMDALGVTDRIIESGQFTRGLQFHAGGATGTIDLTAVDSRYPFTISTPQTETERILRARLVELGVAVEYGMSLTGLSQDDTVVHAVVASADGTVSSIEAGWLIACDGAHSSVRHLLGEKLDGSFVGEHFLMGDIEAEYSADHERMHMFFGREVGVEMLFPMVGRRARLIAQVDATESSREPTIEWLQQLTDDRGLEVRIDSAHWLTTFEIRHAQVPRYRIGRVFLAGDAAHVHSPAGGQGMNTGMQDSFNLGWKLALVVAGTASETLLDSYHAERHPVAAHVIAVTTTITDVGTSKSAVVRGLRDFGFRFVSRLPVVQRLLSSEVEEVRVSYRDSPIVEGPSRGSLRAGDAAPDVAGTSLWTQLHRDDPGHVVLVFGAATPTAPDGVRMVQVTDRDGAIAHRYGLSKRGGVVVVRPDGYIGLISTGNHAIAVESYFDRLFAPTRVSA